MQPKIQSKKAAKLVKNSHLFAMKMQPWTLQTTLKVLPCKLEQNQLRNSSKSSHKPPVKRPLLHLKRSSKSGRLGTLSYLPREKRLKQRILFFYFNRHVRFAWILIRGRSRGHGQLVLFYSVRGPHFGSLLSFKDTKPRSCIEGFCQKLNQECK